MVSASLVALAGCGYPLPVIVEPRRFRYSGAMSGAPQILGSARKYAAYLRRARGGLDYLVFFVTSRCPGGCEHCFNREALNRGDDLSLEEIRRVSCTCVR